MCRRFDPGLGHQTFQGKPRVYGAFLFYGSFSRVPYILLMCGVFPCALYHPCTIVVPLSEIGRHREWCRRPSTASASKAADCPPWSPLSLLRRPTRFCEGADRLATAGRREGETLLAYVKSSLPRPPSSRRKVPYATYGFQRRQFEKLKNLYPRGYGVEIEGW